MSTEFHEQHQNTMNKKKKVEMLSLQATEE
jgi:hypothetical protein